MKTAHFNHSPMTNAEVRRAELLLGIGNVFAVALFVSGLVALWSLRGAVVGNVGLILTTLYALIAVSVAAGWFYWAVFSPPHRILYQELDVSDLRTLKELCDKDHDVKRIVAGWMDAKFTIRLRDCFALHARHSDNERASILESLKTE